MVAHYRVRKNVDGEHRRQSLHPPTNSFFAKREILAGCVINSSQKGPADTSLRPRHGCALYLGTD
ncbi:hypothetical protein RESH_04607 [Rhodopirellula europaea SH398]|uniref:Uncharacterized protein n=2 Tax=Rhodopirellula europaea TaxID=1263866 RepID=M2B146_9BACT|nr:hypothetical protein RE6C_03832 [Rhodopirellula europaea 6C]EMI24821.1 hypothetical protein RESH_04607 [Rhodopirellula europaea SH398]